MVQFAIDEGLEIRTHSSTVSKEEAESLIRKYSKENPNSLVSHEELSKIINEETPPDIKHFIFSLIEELSLEIVEKALLIRINKTFKPSMSDLELYEATRGVWKVSQRRNGAQYAFSVYKGIIKEVYRIDSWHEAWTTKYETRNKSRVNAQGRWEFLGEKAEDVIRDKYIGKDISYYFKNGSTNPVSYRNC